MATNIRLLPLVALGMTVRNNEDWIDAWAYLDGAGNPIDCSGILFAFAMRPTAASSDLRLYAVSAPIGTPYAVDGLVVVGGAGSNVVGLAIARAVMEARAEPGDYVCEMQALADGLTRTVAVGTVAVLAGLAP